MKLEKKKELAARTLDIGVGRIVFNQERLGDIKEAITKQDIRDLVASGAIFVRVVNGRRKVVRRKTRRRAGSVRKKVRNNKREYIIAVRSLRSYLKQMRKQQQVDGEQFINLRNEIRARKVQTRVQLRERLAQMTKK